MQKLILIDIFHPPIYLCLAEDCMRFKSDASNEERISQREPKVHSRNVALDGVQGAFDVIVSRDV